ncbi:MAG: hypothetical protein R3B95_19980, partial [Nitrospirales bacterium]|nr:hypothetical protein [Nitrospirales bacterium]
VYEQAVINEDEPVLNWYQHIQNAASRFSPLQIRDIMSQSGDTGTCDRLRTMASVPVGHAPL